jgi:hypothetical protein
VNHKDKYYARQNSAGKTKCISFLTNFGGRATGTGGILWTMSTSNNLLTKMPAVEPLLRYTEQGL